MDNAHLRELDLSNNPGPGKTGIEKLSGILDPRKRKMPTLRVLKLSEVNLGSVHGRDLLSNERGFHMW